MRLGRSNFWEGEVKNSIAALSYLKLFDEFSIVRGISLLVKLIQIRNGGGIQRGKHAAERTKNRPNISRFFQSAPSFSHNWLRSGRGWLESLLDSWMKIKKKIKKIRIIILLEPGQIH